MKSVDKLTLSVFIIILILVSFGTGFLGRGYYDQILKEARETKDIARTQFLMQTQPVVRSSSTTLESQEYEYKKALQMREEEADQIRLRLQN